MVMKKKMKLKGPVVKVLKFIGVISIAILVMFIIYSSNINDLMDLGYSRDSSKEILFSFNKEYVIKVGENKTLNAAYESSDFKEENLDLYTEIDYVDHDNLIKNINSLVDKEYSTADISIILKHGSDSEVSEFAKRDKIKYLEEFYEYDFAKISMYDRYVSYTEETGEDNEEAILHVNSNLDKIPYEDAVEVNGYDELMLVNKYNYLTEDYLPENLTKFDEEYSKSDDIRASKIVVNSFEKLANDAKEEGFNVVVSSGYRSYQEQLDTIDTYFNLYGQNYVDNYVAKAGFSEHQTGLAIDVASLDNNIFAESDEYTWMIDNAHKYGFILRFPKWGEGITLYNNEPWHYRYVGIDAATYIYENDMTFEEYNVKVLNK